MKKLNILFVLTLALSLFSCKQEENNCVDTPITTQEENEATVYDSTYAAELGADEYGMHAYVMAFLKVGPNRDMSKEAADSLQRAHLDNIMRMAEEGKLLTAGPFLDNGDVRGIYIFNVSTLEEAEALTKTDPAIQAGSLVMELHPWYGPASLQEIGDLQKKVTKSKI